MTRARRSLKTLCAKSVKFSKPYVSPKKCNAKKIVTKKILRAHANCSDLWFAPFSTSKLLTISDFVHLFPRAVIFLFTTDVAFDTKNENFYSKLFFIITLYSYTYVQEPSHVNGLN